MRVALSFLGCKPNTAENALLEAQLQALGHSIVPFTDTADAYLVNTCTVTGSADKQSRNMASRAARLNPDALIILTGCYVHIDAENLAGIDWIDYLFDNLAKDDIPFMLGDLEKPEKPVIFRGRVFEGEKPRIFPERFAGYTRAFLKVQEGCNFRCSYCIIPRARGRSRSIALEDVLDQARAFLRGGHRELVLTGIDLGSWGRDFTPRSSFAELVERLLAIEELPRIRLSSLEPFTFTDRLIGTIASSGGRVCPHLHVPLQSASPTVLRRMRRRYTIERYAAIVDRLLKEIPGLNLGTDTLVGFPGETDDEFEETREFLASKPFGYLHVFNFSPRRGTEAAEMPDQLDSELKAERSRILRDLHSEKSKAYRAGFAGKTVTAMVEKRRSSNNGKLVALSENYLRLSIDGPDSLMGRLIPVKLTDVEGEVCQAAVVDGQERETGEDK